VLMIPESEDVRVALGRAIRRARIRRGNMSQAELADAVPMSVSYLSQVEGGSRAVGPKYLGGIANALGCRPSELFADAVACDPGNPRLEVLVKMSRLLEEIQESSAVLGATART